MRTAKAVLALLVSASVAVPASAQMRAAAAIAGSGVPRVALAVPLAAPSVLTGAPGFALSAPGLSASAFSAAPLAAPSAAALPTLALPAFASLPAASAALPAARAAAPALPAATPSAAPALASALRAASAPSAAPGAAPAAPASAESERSSWEGFWSGSTPRAESDAAVPAAAPADGPAAAPLARPAARTPVAARTAAAAALLVPVANGFHAALAHAVPFMEAGAVLVGAYFANRAAHALLAKFAAKKNLDRQHFAAVRLVVGVALWTGAAALAFHVGGASPQTMKTVFGAGGTLATLGLRDVLGNAIQGVNFLLTRPYAIGTRVSIDDQVGVFADVTPTTILIRKDDGSEVKIQHSALAAKSVIVLGVYERKDAKLRLAVPATPRFRGALGVVWSSLDRRFWIAAAAFAALTAAPSFLGFLAAGWAATAAHVALGGSIAWLTRRVDLALTAAVNKLAEQNGWRPETRALARLAVSAALWSLGGGAVLRLVGISWALLGASVGVTTLGIGLASNNIFSSIVQGAEVIFSKPFKVGDRVKIGTFEGVVEDMTLYHVVIKLDEGRHALVPYAVVRDATLVVTPGKQTP